MASTTYVLHGDGRRTVYNLPEKGSVVTINLHGKKIQVEVDRVDGSSATPGFVIISGYRIYRNGCMTDLPHSYPVSITNVFW
jgi:hypothetical protein